MSTLDKRRPRVEIRWNEISKNDNQTILCRKIRKNFDDSDKKQKKHQQKSKRDNNTKVKN